ncbi:formin-like protein 5 [Impatiens glandulifera]|uniref:formin-like protein 5 n=1 Tax=Impatiens glandulifera TaxID=253017 RepID=UPI001FB1749A|nr:formin-like protein 5 [Impatiens glandulifera]
MGVREVIISLVILLFAMIATAASEEDVDTGRRSSSSEKQFYSDSGQINNMDTAKPILVSCKLELINSGGENFERPRPSIFHHHHNVDGLPRDDGKQRFLECLRRNNIPVLSSGEDESWPKHWYIGFVEFVGPQSNHRRFLQNLIPILTPSPSPSPSPSLSPSPSPSIDHELAPSPSSSGSELPVSPPSPRSRRSPPFFPPNFSSPDIQPSVGADSSPTSAPNKPDGGNRAVVIAVVVTATVTFAVVGMIFLCYTRICMTGSAGPLNDDRPLLSLSMSDYSAASSPYKPFNVGNSVSDGKNNNPSFNNGNYNNIAASNTSVIQPLEVLTADVPPKTTTITVENSNVVSSSSSNLNPPPGMPPLKPPPGRVVAAAAAAPPPPLPPTTPPKPPLGSRPPPPGPPPPPPPKTGPRPPAPPPPRTGPVPPRPPAMGLKPPRPSTGAANQANAYTGGGEVEGDPSNPKTKLKPFFWDKVLANPDQSMVWHQIKAGSFQFNEDMIESLFGYAAPGNNKNDLKKGSSSEDPSTQNVYIIESKKSQNLSILLRAWNVTTEEIHDALVQGNELPSELLETLLKMGPTAEEELKLRLYSGDLSLLGSADRFLKALVEIPFVFKRVESLLFMCTLHDETAMIKESFTVLEAACSELRKNRLFLKLLEAVLKTGNRMNDGTFRGGAQAFKLDTLLKLSDVKGTDGKTTLLHFVVQEIIRSEGIKAAAARERQSVKSDDDIIIITNKDTNHETDEYYRILGLEVVASLGSDLENVRKAAALDADGLMSSVSRLGSQLVKAHEFLNNDMKSVEEDGDKGFLEALKSFVQNAEVDITSLLEDEKRIMGLVKSTVDYFHGSAGKSEGLRLFIIVRDFLIILDKVCKEVKDAAAAAPRKQPNRNPGKEDKATTSSEAARQQPDPTTLQQRLHPVIAARQRMDTSSSSSDDET